MLASQGLVGVQAVLGTKVKIDFLFSLSAIHFSSAAIFLESTM